MCSFAWADREVRSAERAYLSRLIARLDLGEDERRQVEAWLAQPPSVESVDPALVPREHRVQFIRAIESVIAVDGEVTPAEREQLIVLAKLLR